MKILITGANGMLGHEVQKTLKNEHELICADVAELDITNKDKVIEYVTNLKPDYIVNCAAYTAVDAAEDNYDAAKKVNADGPTNLAIAAKMADSILIQISTDYVFDGEKDVAESYKEDEKMGPVTVYGSTKADGEKGVEENCDKYYIFRTAWLYGVSGKNFIKTMLRLGKERDEVNVVNDQHGSPTYAVDLASIIKQAIDKKIPYGIYHTTNQEFTTWYEFTKMIFNLANIDCKVNPVTSEEFASKAKRPKNSQLSKDKILAQGIVIPTYEDGLKRYLEEELNQE